MTIATSIDDGHENGSRTLRRLLVIIGLALLFGLGELTMHSRGSAELLLVRLE
jgi:hypothetical protein